METYLPNLGGRGGQRRDGCHADWRADRATEYRVVATRRSFTLSDIKELLVLRLDARAP